MSRDSRTHFQSDSGHETGAHPRGGDYAGEGSGSEGAGAAGAGAESAEGGGDCSAQELDALRAQVASAEERANAQRDLYLRSAAEIENVRKRAQRDVEQAHRYAIEALASELLPVRDSLELAVQTGATADAATLLAGQEATLKLLQRAFEKFQIRRIDPVGQRFDPNQHEAVLMQPASGAAPNTVLTVVQSGYDLNGRLLRPARVIVAGAGGSDAAPAAS